MDKLVNSDDDIAATAGSIFVENRLKEFCNKTTTMGLYLRNLWSKTIPRKL